MMAFDHVFMEVAKRDSRAIQTIDHARRPATLVFREFYCTEPGCDCRRVVLHLHWVEERRIAASINYAFEPSRRRGEPQISLDPLNPQSEHAPALLAMFREMIAKDIEYRERLIRHYAMWKEVVDDPSHRHHAKVRGPAHDDPSFRPAFPRRKGRSGERNGSRTGKPAMAQGLERVAARGGHAGSKVEKRFRHLLHKVDQLRQRVRRWKEARPSIDAELSTYAALFEQQGRLGREMVGLLDRSYGSAMLSKSERGKLARLIAALAGDLIEIGNCDDLKPLYKRYSRSDFDAEVAAADAAGAEALRSMMEMFGIDFGDADVGSMDKLEAFSEAQRRALEEEVAAEEERRARRKKSAKQVVAEARREDERRRTGKALQDVYRALAMALHPDREQDPGERARKTELMQEVNVAYEAKDLLRLLELQLEVERVEPARAETIAEERLQHYNRILEEQSKQLAVELEELELPFRMEMEMSPSARLGPEDVVGRIRADAKKVQRRIAELTRDLDAFRDATQLKAWLKTQMRRPARDRDFERDLFR